MELSAVTRSVGDIFSVNKRYLVPRFQREYSWEADEVNEFWDDIIQQIKVTKKKVKNEEYFIGCIVLVGDDTKQDYLIVDGQQRLTTLTILLRAITERLKELGDDASARALHSNYIEGTDVNGKKYFKLINETPKPFFQNEIQAFDTEKLQTTDSDEEKLLISSYNGFIKKLKALQLDGLDDEASVRAVRDQVLNYLKFILVTAKHEDDAYTIFETLNARGLSLTAVDLIKNWIFKNYTNTHPNDNAKKIWNDIRITISKFSNLEIFFRHYWNSKYAFASNDRLYKSFNDTLKAKKVVSARDFLLELKSASDRYRKIGVPHEKDWATKKEKNTAKYLELIIQYKVTQVRPFLLALLECREKKNIDETNFIRCVHNLENFHFIFSNLCQSRASGLEGKYASAAKELHSAKGDKIKIKKVLTNLNTYLIDKLPSATRISEAMTALSFIESDDSDKKIIQTIFAKIEQHLLGTKEVKPGDFSLEHIADKSSKKGWIGGIGNLLPLDEDLNNKIKQGSTFKAKKLVYKKSALLLTKDRFVGANPQDTWDQTSASKWLKEVSTLLVEATKLDNLK